MPKATEAWDTLLKKGCDAQDLEWAFFWAVDVQQTLTHVPQILKKFHEQSADLVRKTSKLWPSLKKLMDLRVLERPVWYVYCQFFSFTEKEVWRFFRFPADLVSFQTKLRLFGDCRTARMSSFSNAVRPECAKCVPGSHDQGHLASRVGMDN